MITRQDIESGLDAGEFMLVYQPTVDLRGTRCVGAEVLLRWNRDGQIVAPNEFISIVESTPVIERVLDWTMERIAAELVAWLASYRYVHLGINVPPRIVGRGILQRAAEQNGLLDRAGQFLIEITERGVVDDMGIEAIERARQLGAKVALDDFGTGDANLVQLTRLDVDIIKIDKAFIDQIGDGAEPPRVLKAITAFAKALDLKTIAEGVERYDQVSCLHDLGVKMVQGWYFSKPLPAPQFLSFFESHRGEE